MRPLEFLIFYISVQNNFNGYQNQDKLVKIDVLNCINKLLKLSTIYLYLSQISNDDKSPCVSKENVGDKNLKTDEKTSITPVLNVNDSPFEEAENVEANRMPEEVSATSDLSISLTCQTKLLICVLFIFQIILNDSGLAGDFPEFSDTTCSEVMIDTFLIKSLIDTLVIILVSSTLLKAFRQRRANTGNN